MAVPQGIRKGSTPMKGALSAVLSTTVLNNPPFGPLSAPSEWASTIRFYRTIPLFLPT